VATHFFLRELSLLLADGTPAATTLGQAAPVSVRAVLQRRLAQLAEPLLDTLRLAAVLGERFEIDVLALTEGTPIDQVEARLTGAIRADLLLTLEGGAYRFVHALTRDALFDGIPPAEMRKLHLRCADGLEAGESGDRVHGARLTAHLEQAARLDPSVAQRAVEAMVAAA
jgi:predicted ATPase